MDKTLEAILAQLLLINSNVTTLTERVEQNISDLAEFSERFEEVVTMLENERRLDRWADE